MIIGKKYLIPGVILLLLGISISSCNKVSPAFNRENIKAAWIAPSQNYIYLFNNDNGVTISGIQNLSDGNYKWKTSENLYYNVYCCSLEMSGTITGFFDIPTSMSIKFGYDIQKQKDSLLIIVPTQYDFNETPVDPGYTELRMDKLPNKYAAVDSIMGMWEVKTKDGASYDEFRLQFDNAGTMVYYFKNEAGEWTERRKIGTEDDYYNKYSDFLALTVYDNDVLGTAEKWNVHLFSIDSLSPAHKVLDISSSTLGSYHLEKIE